jgi:hypothetical protein
VPSSAEELRRRLLEVRMHDPTRARSATVALKLIDCLRDKYGYPDDEPRHPNIASGHDWPPEVGDLSA